MVSAGGAAATITVRFRTAPTADVSAVALADVDPQALVVACPWREFRWRAGQKHYSGTYWSATEGRHVIYESRLELARLLFADFDASVHRICSQPFLLEGLRGGIERKHVPDFLLITDEGPKVVDVKPAHRLTKPDVASTFAWTRSALERRGWLYEVWSEPDQIQLQNLRFLAGFRRQTLFDTTLLAALRRINPNGASIAEVIASLSDWPVALIRSALFHLLWSQEFTVDITRQLSSSSALTRRLTT
ncbi:TnsA-like heteromeric transposase endonuclease subunit [[Mycobacterium] nativiensis]|uniref:TnsA-like heteromeric transposase endonuclease subunit n=1 Tax=[Mycobacterium] nativiensis TaxID=2855503 RepID=A0ABU5XZD7_9MYCO|nr:TnsA-like heteromeric transposase endonuclease subunit [Mycolicibacter sp. MYC340]MEB3033359.1 TnsA-like heteromeric transposase endonuclease subunit [Mycolicibacter sp. MYC340]